MILVIFFFFFFFQAEDGIRDVAVTGVQTCALPILRSQIAATSMSRPFVTTEAVAQGSASGGTRATADVGGRVGGPEMHAVALPMAVWRGAATHGVVVPAGARRH